MKRTYWNHNAAYHGLILREAETGAAVLDVGCGDGLLCEKLAAKCSKVVGIEPDFHAFSASRERLSGVGNAEILNLTLDEFEGSDRFDLITFVASIHHTDMEESLIKAKSLLKKNGKIVVIGLAKPAGIGDYLLEAARVIPAKIGSILHGEENGIGVPTKAPKITYREVQKLARKILPSSKLRRGLYYRYILIYKKSSAE